jgi:outer membrane phospholipase A
VAAEEVVPGVGLYQTDTANERLKFTEYEPIYLLYGDPSSKLQFSFKYQLVDSIGIYFGYTQLMFWDLGEDSRPMRDVNYSPDFFYRQQFRSKYFSSVDLSPISHLSNGREGNASRGYSKVFVQLNLIGPFQENTLKFAIRVSNYYAVEDTNQDIRDYLSPIDLKCTITQFFPGLFDKGELLFHLFPGGRYAQNWASAGGQEIGLSFRLGGWHLVPSVFVQYFHGYAESLLDYNKSESIARVGLIF